MYQSNLKHFLEPVTQSPRTLVRRPAITRFLGGIVLAAVCSVGAQQLGKSKGEFAFVNDVSADTSPAKFGLPDFRPLVKSNAMSVVNISSNQSTLNRSDKEPNADEESSKKNQDEADENGDKRDESEEESSSDDSGKTPLEDLFGRLFEGEPPIQGGPNGPLRGSLGSGFILDDEGHILTCAHVIAGASEVTVRLTDRRELVAKVIGADRRSDVALLKVEASDLPAVTIGNPDDLDVGEWVLAIGSPFGFDSSATAGIVSAKGRVLPDESYIPFIQTDVAINPGNSGGPLFDLDGNVIGINAQIYSRTGGFMGLSFAVPIDLAMVVAGQLKKNGRVSRGWLGVQIQEIDQKMATELSMPSPKGALIDRIIADGPASESSLRAGDVIVEFNGVDINQVADLPPVVGLTPAGAVAKVDVIRAGELVTIDVTIGELDENMLQQALRAPDANQPESSTSPQDSDSADGLVLGLALEALEAEQARVIGVDGGLRVTAVESGNASRAGVETGDVLIQYNGEAITTVEQFRRLVDASPSDTAVPILIRRDQRPLFLALKTPK